MTDVWFQSDVVEDDAGLGGCGGAPGRRHQPGCTLTLEQRKGRPKL